MDRWWGFHASKHSGRLRSELCAAARDDEAVKRTQTRQELRDTVLAHVELQTAIVREHALTVYASIQSRSTPCLAHRISGAFCLQGVREGSAAAVLLPGLLESTVHSMWAKEC